LNLDLDILNRIGRLHVERDGLAGQGLDEYLPEIARGKKKEEKKRCENERAAEKARIAKRLRVQRAPSLWMLVHFDARRAF
jgi:hypothetical protein